MAPGDVEAQEALRIFLEAQLGQPVNIKITANRHRLIYVQREERHIVLRAHRIFLGATPPVLQALVQFMRRPTRRARELLRQFISSREEMIEQSAPQRRAISIRPRGAVHDLERALERVCAQHGLQRGDIRITWGNTRLLPPRRAIKFGSYDFRNNLIRVNPALDQSWVPEFFLDYIVYHELLHAKFQNRHYANGRRIWHSSQFRVMEQRFIAYEAARTWEKENLSRFLRQRTHLPH